MKHKHEWEEFKRTSTDTKPYMIRCKICKKTSFPNKITQIYVRHGKISYKTKGAFGRQN